MVLLEKLWDDVVAGPHPDRGLSKLRKLQTNLATPGPDGTSDAGNKSYQRSLSVPPTSMVSPVTPTSPATPRTPNSARSKDNVWRSVFNPGQNLNTRKMGNQIFDKPSQGSSSTVYDWLYSGETRSKRRI